MILVVSLRSVPKLHLESFQSWKFKFPVEWVPLAIYFLFYCMVVTNACFCRVLWDCLCLLMPGQAQSLPPRDCGQGSPTLARVVWKSTHCACGARWGFDKRVHLRNITHFLPCGGVNPGTAWAPGGRGHCSRISSHGLSWNSVAVGACSLWSLCLHPSKAHPRCGVSREPLSHVHMPICWTATDVPDFRVELCDCFYTNSFFFFFFGYMFASIFFSLLLVFSFS